MKTIPDKMKNVPEPTIVDCFCQRIIYQEHLVKFVATWVNGPDGKQKGCCMIDKDHPQDEPCGLYVWGDQGWQ